MIRGIPKSNRGIVIRNQTRLIPAKSILHDAGVTIVRAPLLWFFSAIYILTYGVPLLWVSTIPWVLWLYFLLIPIGILAEAGEIRSVQVQYFNASESLSKIIRHGARRIGALIVVLIASGLLPLILLTIIACPASVFLEPEYRSNIVTTIFNLSNIIAYPIMVFAQCAIIISCLPVKSSLLMFFHVLKKNPFTILAMVIVFGVLRYIIVTTYPTVNTNYIHITGYMLVLLILEGVQATFFTIAYLHYLLKEATTIQPAQSPQLPETQVYKNDQGQQEKSLYQETPILLIEQKLHKTPPLIRQTVQYPSLKARDFLQVMIISLFLLALGFLTVQFVIAYLLPAQATNR